MNCALRLEKFKFIGEASVLPDTDEPLPKVMVVCPITDGDSSKKINETTIGIRVI